MNIFDPGRRRSCSTCDHWLQLYGKTAPAGYRIAPCGLRDSGELLRGSDRCPRWEALDPGDEVDGDET